MGIEVFGGEDVWVSVRVGGATVVSRTTVAVAVASGTTVAVAVASGTTVAVAEFSEAHGS